MFNLVQIQERLKDMPMQALMAYANGQSQEVPPFLALGELNRRKRMQQGAQAEQAKQMEGAPTIKEQIEQQSGLMALQGSRQRQAAANQQGLQALAPSPAPNTTTSEPAQLAAGGAVSDVMGRDFQAGGQVNPEMLKKLMMLKKMQQMKQAKAGLGALMGKDYAGGGIVAFAQGSKDPIGKSPAEDTEEDRRRKASLLGGDNSLMDELQGLGRLPEDRGREETGAERLARKQTAAAGKMGRWYRGEPEPSDADVTEAERMQRGYDKNKAMRDRADANQKRFLDILAGREAIPQRSNNPLLMAERRPPGLPALAEDKGAADNQGIASVARAPQSKAPDLKSDMTDEQQLERIRKLQGLAGVQQNPYADYEQRLSDIEARRKSEQMGPMDKLTELLSNIASSKRGGNWATQGGEAAGQFMKSEEARKQARDKQELDMAALRMSVAKERDARARGDANAVLAEQAKQAEIKKDLYQLETQRIQATKPQQLEVLQQMFNSKDPKVRAFAEAYIGQSKTGSITDSDLLTSFTKIMGDVTSPEARKLKQLGIDTFPKYKAYMMAQMGQTGSGAQPGGKVIDFSSIK